MLPIQLNAQRSALKDFWKGAGHGQSTDDGTDGRTEDGRRRTDGQRTDDDDGTDGWTEDDDDGTRRDRTGRTERGYSFIYDYKVPNRTLGLSF